ncbi:MAG TPA: helix-hairpin-helix domain-containing protein [Oscillatoriaceae cyanobacterium]
MASLLVKRAFALGTLIATLLVACPTEATPPHHHASAVPAHHRACANKTNLNTANIRQLRQLPGIGELLALRIIAARPFRSVEALKTIKGMTPKHFQQLKPLVCVTSPDRPATES